MSTHRPKPEPRNAATSRSIPRLLTVRQAAETLGWKTLKLRRWIAAGRLPCIRVGRSVHVVENDLAALIERSRTGAPTPPAVDEAVRRLARHLGTDDTF